MKGTPLFLWLDVMVFGCDTGDKLGELVISTFASLLLLLYVEEGSSVRYPYAASQKVLRL